MGRKSNQRIHRTSKADALRTGWLVFPLFVALIFSTLSAHSQQSHKYWIQFTDKANNGYSIDKPAAFLSARAIDRRQRQNISIRPNDLPLTQAYVDSIKALGYHIHNRSKWFNAVTITTTDTMAMQKIQQFPFVKGYQPVAKIRIDPGFEMKLEPNRMEHRRAIDYEYGNAYQQIRMIGGDILHDMGYKGEGMLIAVMDAGFYGTDFLRVFENLHSEDRVVATRDFVEGDKDVYDHHTHGTNVMSTMAAELQGEMVGTAPKASYALFRTEDVSSELLVEEDNWVAAAEVADSLGADVCNTSLGYTTFDIDSMDHSYEDMDGNTTRITRGADIAASKGMLIVNSAGNSGVDDWHYIGAPADGDSVLAVGAVDNDSAVAPFSSYGPAYDGDIKPNVAAVGWRTVLWSLEDTSTMLGNGTSYSSPIIAGMSACLWQAFPHKNNMDIFHAIQQSASQYENPDDRMGYGIPNYSEAFFLLSGGQFETFEKDELRVFPNPVQEEFTIYFQHPYDANLRFQLYNSRGQLIWEKWYQAIGDTYHFYPVKALANRPNGVYFLRLDSEGSRSQEAPSRVQKIVKATR